MSNNSVIDVKTVAARTGSTYPEQFKGAVNARSKRVLGDLFGLSNYAWKTLTRVELVL